ncbi:MAG TPA: hypothetical protein VMM18_17195 [Gemmatimonadaceae bacterium]|nr:hypothetical protein [Gemmatimonadaceae bacterium]
MQTDRPTAVKWIVALAWVRLAVIVIAAGAAIAFTTPADSPFWEGFRRGWIERAGYELSTYGAREAGEMVGALLLPAILAVLLLTFVAWRKLIALRVVAGLALLLSLSQPLAWPITVTTLVLTFRDSTRAYLRRASPAVPSPATDLGPPTTTGA